jgi:hypothetical protein
VFGVIADGARRVVTRFEVDEEVADLRDKGGPSDLPLGRTMRMKYMGALKPVVGRLKLSPSTRGRKRP